MAAFFTMLLGVSALLLGYVLYDFSQQNFVRETEAAIDNEIAHILAQLQPQSSIRDTIEALAAQTMHPLYYLHLPDGTKLAGNVEAMPEKVARIAEGVLQFDTMIGEEKRTVAAKIHTFADGTRLLVARDIDGIVKSHDTLVRITILIMLFMLIVVLVSFFISDFVVRRINTIALTAQRIMETGDLSQRIEVDTRWDDLSNLAFVLNEMFERIEQLMQGIRDVSDNIAHDLRTPLTRLRNQLEQLKTQPDTAPPADMLLAEADQLLATFQSLLRIANIEKGKRHQPFQPLDLNVILEDVIELYEPLAEARQITIEASLDALPEWQGDRDLLFQMVANLLDNAIKFSPEASRVCVTLEPSHGRQVLTIADEGVGIAQEERERVFERFFRSDKSRHTHGTGLGLSLVKAVVEMHHGMIRLEDNQPGLRVVVTL